MLKKIIFSLFFILSLRSSGKVSAQNFFCKNFAFKSLDSTIIEKQVKKLLFKQALSGYPFCRFSADSVIQKNKKKLCIYYTLNPQNKVFIKNIFFVGEKKMSPEYIYNRLGIFPGDVYNEKKIKNSILILALDPIIEVLKEPSVEFFPDGADLFLYVNALKINRLKAEAVLNYDEILGKYYLLGNAETLLKNNFHKGEEISFSWTGYNKESQEMKFSLNIPTIFKSPVTTDVFLSLIKTDSLCLNIKCLPKILFKTGSFVETGIFADFRKIIPSSKDNAFNITDTKTRLFGIETIVKQGGFVITNSFSCGQRNKQTISEVFSAVKTEKKLFSNFFYALSVEAKAMITKQEINFYEQYPLGGLQSIRGFEKNQFYAKRYFLINSDLGYYVGKNCAFTVFYDFCFHEEKNSGLGPSFRLSNSSYELNFAYAIPFYGEKMQTLRAAKFHIFITLKI